MIKIFYSSPYNIQHKHINFENAEERLQDDIRSKIIGDVKQFVYASDGVKLKGNENVLYLGGFYYEKDKFPNSKYGECENTVKCELEQINNADIVFVSLLKYSAIASVTELLYASFKGKKTQATISKSAGESYGSILLDLATQLSAEIFYNAMGNLTLVPTN